MIIESMPESDTYLKNNNDLLIFNKVYAYQIFDILL